MQLQNKKLNKDPAALILQIERLAKHTWPAAVQKALGPWELRASGGITFRANSIWTSAGDIYPDGNWMKEAERFCLSQGIAHRYHISDASPVELDKMLVDLDFVKQFPTDVLVAQADEVIEKTKTEANPHIKVAVQTEHDSLWISNFIQLARYNEERKPFYERLFADIRPVKAFFRLETAGRWAAVGTAVVEDGWAGFVNIAVHPELRGQRLGQRLLHELAVWSKQNGADGLYLQVVEDNVPANRLYNKAGYKLLHKYHYRTKL